MSKIVVGMKNSPEMNPHSSDCGLLNTVFIALPASCLYPVSHDVPDELAVLTEPLANVVHFFRTAMTDGSSPCSPVRTRCTAAPGTTLPGLITTHCPPAIA